MVEIKSAYGRNVLCERLDHNEMSSGGIILPVDIMAEKNLRCRLLSKGNGRNIHVYDNEGILQVVNLPSTTAEVGDEVAVRQFEGQPVTNLSKQFFLVDGSVIEGVYSREPWPAGE